MAVGPLAQVILQDLREISPPVSGRLCIRRGKFIVAGRKSMVSNVAVVDQSSNLLVVDIVLCRSHGTLKDFKLALTAGEQPMVLKELIQKHAVRILAGEFREDVRDSMASWRNSMKINVAAWKPWRVSPKSTRGSMHWAMSTSLIFAIGTIQSNKVKYRKSACWEECPCAPDDETMRDHRVVKMTGPFPPDEDRCCRLVHYRSTTFYPPHTKEDKSASWVRIQTVRQISPQRNLPHTQKLIISAGSNRSHRSQSAQRARLANMARRMDIAA